MKLSEKNVMRVNGLNFNIVVNVFECNDTIQLTELKKEDFSKHIFNFTTA